jgi:hypothetical protein
LNAYGATDSPMNIALIYGTAVQYGSGGSTGIEVRAKRPATALADGSVVAGQFIVENNYSNEGLCLEAVSISNAIIAAFKATTNTGHFTTGLDLSAATIDSEAIKLTGTNGAAAAATAILYDTGAWTCYNRAESRYEFWIGSAIVGYIDAGGWTDGPP